MTDDIRSKFFVDSDEYVKNRIEEFAERLLKHCKTSRNGDVFIENLNLSPGIKIKLGLSCRLIAHNLENEIPAEMSVSEVMNQILPSESINAVGSRLSALAKAGVLKKEGRGKYQLHTHKLGSVLDEVDSYEEESGVTTKKKNKKSASRSSRGAGKDIQDLIDEDFFTNPKTVQEVNFKLREEAKYHDVRVIDATMRKTFVSNKKLLKRIPNEGEGKAKWMYVIRK